jgi:peptide-methionine (S)-S-oxide reductase
MRHLTALAAALSALASLAMIGGAAAEQKSAVFAGGCFWCVEEAFDNVPGVTATTSGYTGGSIENPTYEQVSSGGTGHFEVVKVDYDDAKVSYEALLDVFWKNVDPFDARGQFCDKGSQYLSAVFVAGDAEKALAEASKTDVAAKFNEPIATPILPAATFYPAEGYHQNFHVTNAARYKFYKFGCGRAQRLQEIWGDPAA